MALKRTAQLALFAALMGVSACAAPAVKVVEPASATLPAMRWDFRPEAVTWTTATLDALDRHGAALSASVPVDIDQFCPGYRTASADDRQAFWAGLLSALAKYESTWNPTAVGGGGRWFGLVQIDPRTAKGYGCRAQSGAALKDGAANLSCAVRIAAHQVTKRGTVSRGMLDWGPFHSSAKRGEMAAWTRSQAYCQVKPKTETLASARLAALVQAPRVVQE